jgi:hypothetical protein
MQGGFMNEINLYWPVYMNLEKEVLALANYIHFCDDDVFDETKLYNFDSRCGSDCLMQNDSP